MKQTAVEWLENKIEDQRENGNDDLRTTLHYCKQAKEMEDQQQGYSEENMREAFEVGFIVGYKDGKSTDSLTFEQWFEQFKNK